MKKNLLTIAIATALTIATAMPAFAAFIVAPPNDDAYSTEYLKWEREENQRWIDRAINEHADRIKAIESPVDRINEVVKAVASYSEYDPADMLTANRVMQWEKGELRSQLMSDYCVALGKEVGLDIQAVGNMNDAQLAVTNYCTVNDVDYWFDAAHYDIAHDNKYLAHAGQPEWVMTQKQLTESHVDADIITEDIVFENGQISRCVD